MHTPNKPNPRKLNPTKKKTPNTAHCRQPVKQTAQRAENVVEHTVPDKNRSRALNAMRSTQRETRDTREVERATGDETETLRTRSRASNARRNGNGKNAPRNATVGKDGREMRSERTMLADHGKNSTNQPNRNSRTNLGHTLGRRREATARQSSIVHYGE